MQLIFILECYIPKGSLDNYALLVQRPICCSLSSLNADGDLFLFNYCFERAALVLLRYGLTVSTPCNL